MTELTEQQLRRATTLTDHRGRLVKRTYDEADVIEWLAAARAEGARDMRTKIEALADEWAAKADALAPDDGWGDTIGDTVAADSIRAFIAPLRALLADGGEPQ